MPVFHALYSWLWFPYQLFIILILYLLTIRFNIFASGSICNPGCFLLKYLYSRYLITLACECILLWWYQLLYLSIWYEKRPKGRYQSVLTSSEIKERGRNNPRKDSSKHQTAIINCSGWVSCTKLFFRSGLYHEAYPTLHPSRRSGLKKEVFLSSNSPALEARQS